MKAKLVKFSDGTFGVRRWSLFWFGYVLLDLKNPSYWWRLDSKFIRDCHGTMEEVMRVWPLHYDKGIPVKRWRVMTDKPDFAELRAARNAQWNAFAEKMRAEGWQVSNCAQHNKDACYCDCAAGGPCEHDWEGKVYESSDGSVWSTTCSKCGMTAMSHSLRNCA